MIAKYLLSLILCSVCSIANKYLFVDTICLYVFVTRFINGFDSLDPYNIKICFAFTCFANVKQCSCEKSLCRYFSRGESQFFLIFDKSSLKYGDNEQSISPLTCTFVDAIKAIIAPNE